MSMSQAKRRYPIGAELIGENQTHFRVWAPKAREVDVVLEDAAEAKTKILFTDSRARRIFFRRSQRGSPVLATVFGSMAPRIFIPIRHRVFNLMARTDLRALWIRQNSDGATRNGQD